MEEHKETILEALQDYRKWFMDGVSAFATALSESDINRINQIDSAIQHIKNPQKRVIITISGGCFQDIEGLPPDYDYEVNDLDNRE